MLPFVTHGLRLLLRPPLQVQTQPDLAIMAVNTFVKDSQDPNPLIRALAVRTMGCIRVDKITEYLCDPLHRCLKVGGLPSLKLGAGSRARDREDCLALPPASAHQRLQHARPPAYLFC